MNCASSSSLQTVSFDLVGPTRDVFSEWATTRKQDSVDSFVVTREGEEEETEAMEASDQHHHHDYPRERLPSCCRPKPPPSSVIGIDDDDDDDSRERRVIEEEDRWARLETRRNYHHHRDEIRRARHELEVLQRLRREQRHRQKREERDLLLQYMTDPSHPHNYRHILVPILHHLFSSSLSPIPIKKSECVMA